MKIFMNKSIWKKIVIAVLIVFAFQTVVAQPVQAADVIEAGGKLIGPVMSLVVGLGDGINDIVSRTIMGAHSTLFHIDRGNSVVHTILKVLAIVVAAAVAILVIVGTMGVAAFVAEVVGITATTVMGMGTVITVIGAGAIGAVWYDHNCIPDQLYLPMYVYSAEEIFKGNILLYDVNYFKDPPKIKESYDSEGNVAKYFYYDYDHLDEDGNPTKVITSNQNTAAELKGIISSWYNALRNICIVLMLSILVYIGIRILLSSVASDKAKYLTMLKDWFIGLCLLFLMHYIMAFSVTIVEKLTDVVKTAVDENAYSVTLEDEDGKIADAARNELKLENVDEYITKKDGTQYFTWPTNLMGRLRLDAQMESYGAQYVGYAICFWMLTLFTLYFTVVYMKRVLHMAFLTIIAPLVALTYCIDKLNDGKAQGFDRWFKEYIFNLLIQPMHLLLYYILVTSAIELAVNNTLYSIIALGFMLPAEKLLRSMFGFEKAQTAPAMGPAGAMMASTVLNNILNKGKGKAGGSGSGSGRENDTPDKPPITTGYPGLEEDDDEEIGEIPPEGGLPTGRPMPGSEDDEEEDDEESTPPIHTLGTSTPGGGQPIGRPMPGSEDDEEDDDEEDDDGSTPLPSPSPTPSPSPSTRFTSSFGRKWRRAQSARRAAQLASVRSIPKRIRGWAANTHPARRIGRTVAGVALGSAAGAIGTAIAASTGDAGNVAKIGLGAAATGYTVASNKVQAMKNPMDNPDTKAVYNAQHNKGEYKKDAMNDYVKEYLSDVKNRHYFEQKFGKDNAKEMRKRGGIIEKCLYSGITEQKEIAAVYKLHKDDKISEKQAIEIAELGQMTGDTKVMGKEDRDDWRARFEEIGEKKGVKNKKAFAKDRFDKVEKFHDYKRG